MNFTTNEAMIIMEVHALLTSEPERHNDLNELMLIYANVISKTKLKIGFKKKYNLTLYQFHLQTRMGYAKEQLNKGLQVKVLALSLGYSTSGSFSRAFKKVYPHPPGYFRYHTSNT
ncbi:AraC family transcriptional regulator [Chitinophaga sancti]|uniref:helix-turn-helix domain-containing protein n=1 Tax=Chitinophaga sancti TaxID=1004 RepID=UPI002A747B93|nr:AraC family transcriptional regulator [Chitinophaga sancti]WPQ61922.1 AraC family transcriptional regulator [Chitinophaga sancti]